MLLHQIITSNNYNNLEKVAKEINCLNDNVLALVADARYEEDMQSIINQVIKQYGKIDILVNNVGLIGRVAPFEEISDSEWLELFELNVMSVVRLSRAVLPYMKRQQWGRILFISSERAIEPKTLLSHYAMTKAAILSITKSLANEIGKYGITVNSLSPGVILTTAWDENAKAQGKTSEQLATKFCNNVMPEGSLGKPDDVAEMVCFLCSERAGWMTGSNFRVDGGSIESIQA